MTEPQIPDQVVSIHIDVPVQRVWDEITKTGRIQPALFNTVMESELTPGARLRYYSPNRERVFVIGEVVEIDPPTRFVHTYRFTMWKSGGPTLVTWELEEEAGGTRVTVTHSGWTGEHEAPEKTGAGWQEILALLKRLLETGGLPWTTRLKYRLMDAMTFMLPESTKVETIDAAGVDD